MLVRCGIRKGLFGTWGNSASGWCRELSAKYLKYLREYLVSIQAGAQILYSLVQQTLGT